MKQSSTKNAGTDTKIKSKLPKLSSWTSSSVNEKLKTLPRKSFEPGKMITKTKSNVGGGKQAAPKK